MKIGSSDITMAGTSNITSVRKEQKASLSIIGRTDLTLEKGLKHLRKQVEDNERGKKHNNSQFQNGLNSDQKEALRSSLTAGVSKTSKTTRKLPEIRDYRLDFLERMLQLITGRKFKLTDINDIMTDRPQTQNSGVLLSQPAQNTDGVREVMMQQTDIFYQKVEVYESQSFSFQAQGQVVTADGRTINFDLQLNMSSEFYSKIETFGMSQQMVKFCDPLVINYAVSSAGLADGKITFDLDCDGTADQISRLIEGSGFLAYDKNGDGVINDGSELFGAKSGDGFKDLAVHDDDGNGWIDENDWIFDKLRIWITGANGESKLIGLGEAGIGAIFLGNISGDYNLYGDALNGQLKKTGIFLKEDGTAGTVQHVDFVI